MPPLIAHSLRSRRRCHQCRNAAARAAGGPSKSCSRPPPPKPRQRASSRRRKCATCASRGASYTGCLPGRIHASAPTTPKHTAQLISAVVQPATTATAADSAATYHAHTYAERRCHPRCSFVTIRSWDRRIRCWSTPTLSTSPLRTRQAGQPLHVLLPRHRCHCDALLCAAPPPPLLLLPLLLPAHEEGVQHVASTCRGRAACCHRSQPASQPS